MISLVERMFNDHLVTKNDISILVRSRPPKKISVANLINEGILDPQRVNAYLVSKVRKGEMTLEDVEKVDELDIVPVLQKVAEELNIQYVDLDDFDVDMHLFNKVPYKQLIRYNAMPIEETDLSILVSFADALDMVARDTLQRLFPKKPIHIAISKPSQIRQILQQLEMTESIKGLVEEIRKDLITAGSDEQNEESPAVLKLIEIILKSAIASRASDIHVEATEKNSMVRDRIDGMLRQSFIFDKDIFAPLASRMKLLSNLDIAEKRKPQDGRFSATINGREYDFRVSSLPTLFGESIVIRILDKTKVLIKLEDAGMSTISYDRFYKAIQAPFGIILVTGPTGSGKTTTLYGALNAIKDVKDKIITVEDPVEYQMNGIQQVQVNAHVGLGFADALRSILRQDPDKIMVGEIRDHETLRVAIQAALTGHLVISTLHTNDAISAVNRILDMGIESYLVSGALVGIQAQRLVRKICPHCKTEFMPSEKLISDIREYLSEEPVFYRGEGCKECQHSGYMGREMISEVLPISETLSRMIAAGASKEEMSKQAIQEGFVSMFEDGINKALAGETTLEEVYRVARL
ncbi:MAG TPA: type II/IV secretion system protein [Epsilonproteobacteria bacterium]|nr:type II/IV secretion system protein [Campylobacterota bacterium]